MSKHTDKMLKVTISGSYRTASKEIVDFEGVTGLIPFVDEEHAKFHVRSRYALPWVKSAVYTTGEKKGEKIYKERIEDMRQVFIDTIEEVEGIPSYIGKNIKELTFEEYQDLATAKDLRRIPLPKEISGVDLREMRSMAYMDYASTVLGMDDSPKLDEKRPLPVEQRINPGIAGYNFAKLPDIVLEGGVRVDTRKKVTNEELLELEANTTNLTEKPGSNLTLEDLKTLAKQKNIPFHPNIKFDALYEKLYGQAA